MCPTEEGGRESVLLELSAHFIPPSSQPSPAPRVLCVCVRKEGRRGRKRASSFLLPPLSNDSFRPQTKGGRKEKGGSSSYTREEEGEEEEEEEGGKVTAAAAVAAAMATAAAATATEKKKKASLSG